MKIKVLILDREVTRTSSRLQLSYFWTELRPTLGKPPYWEQGLGAMNHKVKKRAS